jgi:hypothetical protein
VGAIGGGALLIGLIVLLFLFIPFGSASGISAEALRFIPKDADSIDGYTIPTSGQPAIILRKTIRKLCDAADLKGLNDDFVNDIQSFMTAKTFAKVGRSSVIVAQMRKPQDAEKLAGLIDAKKTEEFKGKNVYAWKNGYLYLPNPNLVVLATIHDKDKEKEFGKLLDDSAAAASSELARQAQQLSHHQNWEVKKFPGSDADKSGKMPLSSHGYSNFAADGKSMQVEAVQVMANAAAAEEFVAKFKENQSKMKAGDESEFGNVNLRSSGSSVYMTITMSGKVLEKMLERM